MARFDRSSFFRGLARAFDLRGAVTPTYAYRARWQRDDRAAIASDWAAVWNDYNTAFARVRQREGGGA